MKEIFCLIWITLEGGEALLFVQTSGTRRPVRQPHIPEDAILHSHLLTFHMNQVTPFKDEDDGSTCETVWCHKKGR
jgi:hypothetical protein